MRYVLLISSTIEDFHCNGIQKNYLIPFCILLIIIYFSIDIYTLYISVKMHACFLTTQLLVFLKLQDSGEYKVK